MRICRVENSLPSRLFFKGESLVLNFSTSAAGSFRLEIQDGQGDSLPGFALEEFPLIWDDEIEHTVCWDRQCTLKTNTKLTPLLRRISKMPIRLRFVIKDVDLYSLRFK